MFIRIHWLALASALVLSAPAPALAEEKSVAEEILDILKSEGRINDTQYQALTERARAETAARNLPPVAAKSDWDVSWKDGITVANKAKGMKVRVGGRLMYDWAQFDADKDITRGFANTDLDGGSGTEMRRARIFFDGRLSERLGFKWQMDFAGGGTDLKDAYLRFLETPYVQNVTVGHFKEPFSLEELVSSKYGVFMERSLINAFAPSRNAGIAIGGPIGEEQMTWNVGVFRETDGEGFSFTDRQVRHFSGRVTGVPFWEDGGERMVHVGFNYNYINSQGDLRFRARPEAHLSPVRFVDTSSFAGDDAHQLDAELAMNFGPLSLQGEAVWSLVNADRGDDPDFFGFYAQASYFLTGESRPYKRKSGTFSRVKPMHDFGSGDGFGALQLAARYSYISLNDGDFRGGRLGDFTAGLNWYLNPNIRFMFNYVYADLKSNPRSVGPVSADPKFDGHTNIFQARMQADF